MRTLSHSLCGKAGFTDYFYILSRLTDTAHYLSSEPVSLFKSIYPACSTDIDFPDREREKYLTENLPYILLVKVYAVHRNNLAVVAVSKVGTKLFHL